MDSIGDNVMMIICVVVGILIIGCALIPIVDNASHTTEDTTAVIEMNGDNTVPTTSTSRCADLTTLVITVDGTTTTINGETVTGVFNVYSRLINTVPVIVRSYHQVTLDPVLTGGESVSISTGTVTYNEGTLTATDGENTYSAQFEHLYINRATDLGYDDLTKVYANISSPCIIGEGQRLMLVNDDTVITADTTEPPEGVTITKNEGDTFATVTFSSGSWFGPIEWEGTRTTGGIETVETEYAALYNMIPVLCILGMAYVLIRRFY